MRKNRTMRFASGLLILTLLTMSIIGGTFAKYTTSDSASDTARVAKFGVTVAASGSLFDTTYKKVAGGNTPGGDAADLTVVSSNSDKVVAPGTTNTDGLTFAVAGTPEVDVHVAISVTDVQDVFLAQNADPLPDMTTGNGTDTFTNSANYYPIKYTLSKNGTPVTGAQNVPLATIQSTLNGMTGDFDAGTNLATAIGNLKITWAWDFDGSGAGTYDKQDTLLGDLAAGTTLAPATDLTAGTDYNLNTAATIGVTITQID